MKATRELITQLREGSLLAFNSIYDLYSAHIYNFIKSLMYDEVGAEDLTQEVFVKLWERKDFLNVDRNFDAYLFMIARNLVYDEWDSRFHSENYVRSLDPDRAEEGVSSSEDAIMAGSLGEYIDTLINKLPPARRQVFLLSRKQHLSTKEIAQQMSISERTVEAHVYRALQFLRKHLSEEGIMTWILMLILNKS